MVVCTHSNQILFGVVAQMAPRLDVMDLQVGSVPQLWHRQPLLPQDLLLQRPIGLGRRRFELRLANNDSYFFKIL